MKCAYVPLHCVAKVLFQGHNMRKRKLKCEREEKVKLKAKNREVNNIVLKADTSLSALLLFRVCSSTVALWLAAWHALACLNRTSKDTAPWRIESWGHELHSYPHKDKPSVSAPLKTDKESSIEMLWNAEGRGNQMPIDFNASSVRNDFLPHNRWRVEKWVLKPGLWEIKGSRCSAAHVNTHTHNSMDAVCSAGERLRPRKPQTDRSRKQRLPLLFLLYTHCNVLFCAHCSSKFYST